MADCDSPALRELYRQRRTSAPIFFDEQLQSYFVYRYDDVKAAAADWQSFSSDFHTYLPSSPLARVNAGMLSGLDPPRHAKLRSLVSRAFTPRSVADMAPHIDRVSRKLIAAWKERGSCDLVAEFAGIVPVLTLADLLGVPGERHAYFRDLVRRATQVFDATTTGKPLDSRPHEELQAYFTELLEERRQHPREDMISRLLAAEVDGERLGATELTGFCKLLLIAGIGTVARLIALSMWTLLEHRDELARLRADMQLLPSAIEEVMRFRPPINTWFRVSAKDLELSGHKIAAHKQVLLVLGSANRDDAHFVEPDKFDITRTPNAHLAFSNGMHFCVGAPLARLESKVALTALFEELSDIELANAEPITALPGIQANGPVSLPIRFRATRTEVR